MRVTYTDESGSSPSDPLVVQAAVIVHGDIQVVPIEEHLESLVAKHIPEKDRPDFFFHATEIYRGGSRRRIFHNKEEWPNERRFAILDDLVAVPKIFGLPVCFGLVEKSSFVPLNSTRSHSQLEITVGAHARAILLCELAVEVWMRSETDNEITHIVAEDNAEVHDAAREAHVWLKSKEILKREGFENHPCLPLVRIRDGLQFTSKKESRLLQIADVCAWSIRRFFSEAPNYDRFHRPIHSQVVRLESGLSLRRRHA
jgi:hypothetical protein